jgi:hypothetical protein
MIRQRRAAYIFTEMIIVGLLVIVAIAIIMNSLQKSKNTYKKVDSEGSDIDDEMVRKWKKQAELVIVGRMLNRVGEGTGDAITITLYGFFNIAVESVERGHYPYDTIKAYIGWISNLDGGHLYPPFIKQNYRMGDRVRIYLNYDQLEGFGYYTPGALYTIEPLR